MKYIIAIDQGTTSSRSIVFDQEAKIIGIAQEELTQYFPKPGWVEHDPKEIWETQLRTLQQVIKKTAIVPSDIAGIGITNQRETAVVWNKNTGKPIGKAIVWQDKRTASICENLKSKGLSAYVKSNTGLVIDAYFSATKVRWMLDNIEGAKDLAHHGDLAFGTVDSWLLWKLTEGKVHATDYTNASRTMVFNIHELAWDDCLLETLEIPKSMLPKVYPSMHDFGMATVDGLNIPVLGIGGDQQSALFGQACIEAGMAKNTYGTGCFMLMNTGSKAVNSAHGLLTTIACSNSAQNIQYALEGSTFIAGAAIQWLRDGLEIIQNAKDSEALALEAGDQDEVYVVPAFSGLGAPYWDMYARGAIFGLTRDTGKAHLTKATLQSLAYQTKDVLVAMEKDAGLALKELKVDGGACANDFLMQFQADILGTVVERPEVIESTALGAAYLAGIQAGLWRKEGIAAQRRVDRHFQPNFSQEKIAYLYGRWQEAIKRSMGWMDGA